MMSLLKNHPFAVEAFFKHSLVLTFAVPKEKLATMIPPCLELDLLNDEFGFIAVAMVQTQGLRPKGLPKFLGNNFFLTGYRIFVRYTNNYGKRLRGLYIIKSETNKKKMEFFGNFFTHYNYTTTDISTFTDSNYKTITSKKSGIIVKLNNQPQHIALPQQSPFASWNEARRYAGPLPFTFTYNEKKKQVLIIEGVRQDWNPKPVEVLSYNFYFLNSLHLEGIVLANAFAIDNIPYYWKKGKLEVWK